MRSISLSFSFNRDAASHSPFSIFHYLKGRTTVAILFIFLASSSAAQKKPDTSFHLLWFKGKKINDSSLLKPTGEKVNYSASQGSVSIIYPAGQDPFTGFRNGVNRDDESKKKMDLVVVGDINNPRTPGLVVEANNAFDQAVDEMMTLIENRIPLRHPLIKSLAEELAIRMNQLPAQVRSYYDDVMKYVKLRDWASSFTPVMPPSYNFDYCYPCDEERKEKYKRDSAAFINSFLSVEKLNMGKTNEVLAYLQRQKMKPGPDSIFIMRTRMEMFDAITVISQRMEMKMVNIWDTYKGIAAKVPFLVSELMKMDHIHELMGIERVPGFPTPAMLADSLFVIIIDTLQKANKIKDYRVLLNARGIIRLFKFAQLLGLESEKFETGLKKYLNMNRFKVTVDAEVKIASEGTSQMAKLHFEEPFDAYPEPKDITCTLKWFPHGMDSAKGLIFKLRDKELKADGQSAVYTGTTEFGAKRPALKLDFCDLSRDTALFYPFFPYKGMDVWNMGEFKDYPFQVVNTTFMVSFMDEEAIRKKGEELQNNPRALEEIRKQITSIHLKTMPNAQSLITNPVNMSARDYEKAAALMDAADEMNQLITSTSLYYFPIKAPLKNFDKLVFDQTLDGKKISKFPSIVFATFRVRIEHIEE